MSSKLVPIITDIGLEAIKGTKVTITHIAVGIYDKTKPDSHGYTPLPSNTELRNQIFKKEITRATIDDTNTLHVEAIIDNNDLNNSDLKKTKQGQENYSITEIAFLLGSGDIFAIFATEKGSIASKNKDSDLYLNLELSIFSNLRSGTISGFSKSAINIDNQTICESKNHKLIEGDVIKLTDNDTYEDNYQICNVTQNSFNIHKKFTPTDDLPASWAKEYEVSYKIDESYNNATLRETLFQGVNLIKISTQKEFDQVFNKGNNTKIRSNTTIILSPIQEGYNREKQQSFNGRPGYLLKNTLLLGSNISIRGFNTNNTIIIKNSSNVNIQLIGTRLDPIKGVELKGWTFDGRGGINNFGGYYISDKNGAAFYLSHAENCKLNCQIINHNTISKGGGIFGTLNCKNITAENISWNKASYGNDVYGCSKSLFKGANCRISSNHSILFNYDLSRVQIVHYNLPEINLDSKNNEDFNDPQDVSNEGSKRVSDKLPWATIEQKGIIKLATIEDIKEGTSNELAISVGLLKKVLDKVKIAMDPMRGK